MIFRISGQLAMASFITRHGEQSSGTHKFMVTRHGEQALKTQNCMSTRHGELIHLGGEL